MKISISRLRFWQNPSKLIWRSFSTPQVSVVTNPNRGSDEDENGDIDLPGKRALLNYSPKELASLLDGAGRAKIVWDRIRFGREFFCVKDAN